MTASVTAAYMLLLQAVFVTVTTHLHPLSDEYIALINSKQDSWIAGRNFPADTSMKYIKRLMGAIKEDNIKFPVKMHDADLIASLPDSFDARKKWPNCPSINEIRDQGSCGSCWALSAVETMTDRVCTYSNGVMNFYFSAQDVLSCCSRYSGCEGGLPGAGFRQWEIEGIVSGGMYNSSQGCKPYEIAPCEHHVDGNRKPCEEYFPTPDCVRQCVAGYNVDYKKDRHYAKHTWGISGEGNIKAELFLTGPVSGVFAVHTDFLNYKTGVYKHVEGDFLNHHAIKILGWGVEGGEKYWLIANSWNTDWGDNGFVKFLRGVNHCSIEDQAIAGEPALDDF